MSFLGVSILTLAWMNAVDLVSFLISLIGAVLCLLLIFFHKIMARAAMRRTLKMHGGKILQTVVTLGDNITLREGDESISLAYGDLVKVIDCGNIYALMFGKSSGVIVKKDGFVKGDFKAFPLLSRKSLIPKANLIVLFNSICFAPRRNLKQFFVSSGIAINIRYSHFDQIFKEEFSMVISIGCDNLAIDLKNAVIEEVKKLGHEVLDFGVKASTDPYDYPDVAYPVAKAVADKKRIALF